MRGLSMIALAIDRQRGYLALWVPVLFATGIGVYFSLPVEPQASTIGLMLVGVFGAALAFRWSGPGARVAFTAFIILTFGFLAAVWRAHDVSAPVLSFRYYGPIEGRIVVIDRSQSDAVRLTLDHVVLSDVRVARTPERVRVSLHGRQGFVEPEPGLRVVLTGHLSPPSGPVEPGGFDFQRQAWFKRLGAVGYTRTPVLALADRERSGVAIWITRMRVAISRAVQDALPGRAGGFASAITTGDRSGMDRLMLEALRASNLAHLLAISGLHMGLLTGFVFAAVRFLFAAIPSVVLHYPSKKIAACIALLAGAAYLALSGGNVATERAFVMVAVMYLAVLADRRAITLRAVAVAAMIVLTLRPEALLGPGFQMSFAATTALVAVYSWMRDRDWSQSRWPWALRVFGGVALSSAVAGLATAPFAAAHFNQVPHYGLLANILSVPLMGAVIIPAAVLAALLTPFGLSWVGLVIMEPPILWILWVAETVSSWPGALSFVHAPGPRVLPLLALGGITLVLWRGRARGLGFVMAALAMGLWSASTRPDILVSETGGLLGVMTVEGRAMSKPKGDGFSASSWLENDGDPVEQSEAAARLDFDVRDNVRALQTDAGLILHATGKVAGGEAAARCRDAILVVVNVNLPSVQGCNIFDATRMRETGSLALYTDGDFRIVTARQLQGARLWSQ